VLKKAFGFSSMLSILTYLGEFKITDVCCVERMKFCFRRHFERFEYSKMGGN
jgi:hypothetical protein